MKNVTIDGIKYELNVEQALTNGCLRKKNPAPKIGNTYTRQGFKFKLILTNIKNNLGGFKTDKKGNTVWHVGLLNMCGIGQTWSGVVEVADYMNITDEEWILITGKGFEKDFQFVTN